MDKLDGAAIVLPGVEVRLVERCTSTNDLLLKENNTVLLAAEEQTTGRGRRGRRWHSAPGAGLTFSLGRRIRRPARELAALSLVAGVAAARALRALGVRRAALKWPNDLLAPDGSGRKLGGVLTETRSESGRIVDAVIGIGVNLVTPAAGWDVDGAACPVALDEFAHDLPDARTLAPEVARALEAELAALARDGADVVARARAAMPLWGRRVRGEQGTRLLEGTAKDLAPDGGLVIRLDSGAEVVVHAGDVRVAWEAS